MTGRQRCDEILRLIDEALLDSRPATGQDSGAISVAPASLGLAAVGRP
jgi:hypothetical protein